MSDSLWPHNCSTPGFPVLHYFLGFAQTHVHWVTDAIQLSYPLLSPSPPALNLSQHQGFLQWVGSSHQVAKVLELQLQRQSFSCRMRDPFQGLKLGSCLTLRNELSEETHMLTKQEILLGKCAQRESSRIREPRRTALPHVSQFQVLWWWDSFLGCL